MKKNIVFWLSVPLMVFILIYGEVCSRKEQVIRDEYMDVRYTGGVKNLVKDDFFKKWGSTYLILNDIKTKIPQSFNNEIKPYDFCDFLMVGDSIIMEAGSDFIIIKRNSIEYTFKIGDYKFRKRPEYE